MVDHILKFLHQTLNQKVFLLTVLCLGVSSGGGGYFSRLAFAENASLQNLESYFGKKVSKIDVKGMKRIEKDALLAKITTKVGGDLSRDLVRSDIQAVFAMGFFDEVELRAERGSGSAVELTFEVRERPAIAKVEFEGNERLTTTDLQEVIKVKEWSILDVNKVKEDTVLIQRHYEEKGFYLAKVTFEVRPVAGKSDEVHLIYHVNDYEKVQIKRITFLNNKRYSDQQLKAIFQETKEGSAFSFLSGSGSFKESAFKQDLSRLQYWYLDHGYVKFAYENPVVTISDDKKYLYISVYVNEGEQYSMGALDFSGDLLFPKEELNQELLLGKDQVFSISKRNADIQKLTEKYQDLGYAFANVIPKMDIHDESKTVDVNYAFEKGNLVHFGEIYMVGNSKTHDKVIRRELRIHEGELYSGTKIRESRENVERLGYFGQGEVIFNTITPKDKNDILNVEISVKERSTGTITLGAGYGTVSKFFFQTQVSEINLLGRGQTVSLAAQLASDRRQKSFNLGFTDPYAFDTHWSAGADFFFVNSLIPNRFLTRKLGFDLRFGHPIPGWDYTNGYITYKNEGMRIEQVQDTGIDQADIDADTGVLSSTVYSVVRDKRNNRFETTGGNYQSLSLETAGLGGDKKFIKFVANQRYYTKIVGDLVFRNSIEFGQVAPVAGRPVPPSERFYLGGPNNLKGYDLFSVGPNRIRSSFDGSTSLEPLGGRTEVFALFELEYPLIREAGLKIVAFYDAGNAYAQFPKLNHLTIRTDAGFGFRWFSPIGPLRFEWGFPFRQRPGESDSVFNFFIGPPF